MEKIKHVHSFSNARIELELNRIAIVTGFSNRIELESSANRAWIAIVTDALLTFKDLKTGKPDYLSDQLQLCAPVRQLRSSDGKNRLYLNTHWTTFASRAFCNAAPVVWNNLPHHLTDDLSCPASFRHNLKTHLFSKSFHHWLPWPVRNCYSSIYFWLKYVASPTA